MAINVTKFMVTVETKNYPVVTIRPTIQRYARIRKKMNASEIAQCLSCYAIVTLEKNNGIKVRLTADNFKQVLRSYTAEINNVKINKGIIAEEDKNATRVEKIKEEPEVITNTNTVTNDDAITIVDEQVETTEQADPEDEDTFDSSPYYENDDD